jgi:leucyl/phenylalanyl-tRNA---protein transferase
LNSVLVGGSLDPDWLLDAYRHGIFPWPLISGLSRMQWWSPDPRAIFDLDKFHASRRLLRTCRSGRFEITSDRGFAGVLRGCATAQSRRNQTWLTREMMAAYQRLVRLRPCA